MRSSVVVAASPEDEIDALHTQRLRCALLQRETERLRMRLFFGGERLTRQLRAGFAHAVRHRFRAIRDRYRVSAARLARPVQA
jgi:hypothetical protein